jgi:hypothetical protein
VRALDAQQNSVRCRNEQGEGSTTHQTGKNPGSNSGLPQEAEEETDHLSMRHPSNHLLAGEALSFSFRAQDGSTVLYESM